MGLRINTNVDAFSTHRTLSLNASRLSKSMERLSSGFRINRAADDAAGLGISERMRSQIRGYEQASRNAQDGISYANTAEGALGEISSMLQRMRELAVQHMNGTTGQSGRSSIEREGRALYDEITRVINGTMWNGASVLQNAPAVTLQVGPDTGNTLTIAALDADNTVTGINMGTLNTMFPATFPGTATMNLTSLDTFITNVSRMRGTLGAVTNRLEYTVSNLGVAQENMMAAESRIRDVDMAKEMTNLSRLQILEQSGIAMLAQANGHQSTVLNLLK